MGSTSKRTIYAVGATVAVFAASFIGLAGILRAYGLPWMGILLVVTPAVLVCGTGAVFGASLAWRNQDDRVFQAPVRVMLRGAAVVLLLSVATVIPGFLALYLVSRGRVDAAAAFSFAGGIVGLWGLRKLGVVVKELRCRADPNPGVPNRRTCD